MNCRFSILILLVALRASSATLYVSVAGSGAANGADWSNTLAEGFTPVRGNTYYYADGSYASKTFSAALSGTSLITLQKATVADHGTSTGWSDSLGDGQATFAYPLTFSTGYWTLDGATGTNLTTCGFIVSAPTSCATATQHYIVMGTGSTALDNMTFAHVASLACSDDVEKLFFYFGTQVTANNFTARYIYADGFQGTFFLWGVSNVLTEYVTITNAFSSGSHHGEQWNMRFGSSRSCRDVTIRYCTIADSVGTGCIIANDGGSDEIVCLGLNVYGNVFRGGSGGNGIIGATTRSAYANAQVFNNTFSGASTPWIVAAQSGSSATIKNATTNIVATNNIIFNMSAALGDYATAPIVHDYNLFVSATSIPSEANGVTTSSNPFVNSAGFNFRLATNTPAGATLAATFNTDPDGTTRSTWSRGAYEYTGGGGDVTAPTCAITSPASVSSGGSGSYSTSSSTITVSGTSDDATATVTWSNSRGGAGTATGSTSWSKSGITLASGGNVLSFVATDPSANATTTTLNVTYTVPSSGGGSTNNVGTLYIR